jgi:hypothetical protein
MIKVNPERLAIGVKAPLIKTRTIEYEVVSDVKIDFTHKKATELLEMETFKGEREALDSWVQTLYNAYCAGRFMWEQVTLGICRVKSLGNRVFRVNGQHTCWMRLNIEEEIPEKVRLITYQVDDEEQLRALYATFDQGRARSQGHLSKVLLVGRVSDEIWPSLLPKLSNSMKFWLYGDTHRSARSISSEDIASVISGKYADLIRRVALVIQKYHDNEKMVRRIALQSAMLATYHLRPDNADAFWDPVLSGLGLTEKTDPRYKLRQFLLTHGHGEGANNVPKEDSYRICLVCWNKWRTEEKMASSPRTSDTRPKIK